MEGVDQDFGGGGRGPTGSVGGGSGYMNKADGGFIKHRNDSVQIPKPNGCGLNLRKYWSNSNSQRQTYESPRDAVFLVNGSNWTSEDLTTLGITSSDVIYIYSGNKPSISIVTDMDDYAGFGYYIITRPTRVTFSTWAKGTYVEKKLRREGAPGRKRDVDLGTFILPKPDVNDLIVLAWRDNKGINKVRYTVAYSALSTKGGQASSGGSFSTRCEGKTGGAGGQHCCPVIESFTKEVCK